mgnify:CR=1 FL=1
MKPSAQRNALFFNAQPWHRKRTDNLTPAHAKSSQLKGIKRKLFDWAVGLGSKYDNLKSGGAWYNIQLALANKIIFSKWRERKLRQEKEQLQVKVEERTVELKKKSEELEAMVEQLRKNLAILNALKK